VKVDPQAPEASDECLAVKVRSRLLLKPELSLSGTGVDVKGGVVTLTGAAESDRQKALTEATVKSIAGVRAVRNHLEVVERASGPRGPANQGNAAAVSPVPSDLPTGREADEPEPRNDTRAERIRIEDEAITTQIEFELLVNKETGGLKTKVETQRGRVTISGEAESERQRELISRLAQRVGGVVDVDNQVVVRRR
jgi:hyperosmotically inducible periplasmic protein